MIYRSAFVDLSNNDTDDSDVKIYPQHSPIKRSVTSMSLVRPDKRSTTSMSVNLPFRRSTTGISLNNIPNIRSSTSLSMANPTRRKSGNLIILQEQEHQANRRPITAAVGANGDRLLSKRKESQVRLETPDFSNTMAVVPFNNKGNDERLNDTRNTFSGFDQKLDSDAPTPRPKTSPGHSSIVKLGIKGNKGQGQSEGHSKGYHVKSRTPHSKNTLSGFFVDEQEKPTLLQLHKERVKSANYMTKIDSFVDDLKEWKADERDIIHDYYYIGQVETNRHNSVGQGEGSRRISMKPAEIRKHTGDMQIKNLTFPKLDI